MYYSVHSHVHPHICKQATQSTCPTSAAWHGAWQAASMMMSDHLGDPTCKRAASSASFLCCLASRSRRAGRLVGCGRVSPNSSSCRETQACQREHLAM